MTTPRRRCSPRPCAIFWTINDGHALGPVVLNRAQVAATFAGDRIGLPSLAVHAQVFNFAGSSLSARTGDIQTADAIEAVPMARLFKAWVEQRFGSEERNVAIRAGLMDVNANFDSIVAANWVVNSSQGIGADIARCGLNGPQSIRCPRWVSGPARRPTST